jgi:hypothetical protein
MLRSSATRSAVASLAAAALTVLAASCGGGDDPEPPDDPPESLLRQAAANPPRSGDAAIGVDLALEGNSLLAGASALRLDGPFSLDPDGGLPAFDFGMDAELAGFGVDGGLVSTGEDAFVVFFGENYRVGPERTADLENELATALAANGGGLMFDEWIRDARYEDVEEVGGVDAVRIVGVANPEAAVRDLGALAGSLGLPSGVLRTARVAGGPAEAWVGLEDWVLRRIRVQLAFEVPAALRARAGEISAGTLALDAEVSDVGAEVTVKPPPGGGFQPIEDLIDRIGSLAGLAL